MKIMSDALMEVAGDKMRNILATMTSNRVFGVFTGFIITSLIQSSSATTLMVVSFVNASLLTLTESVSVVMGANIGTTITAWLITILGFKVSMSAIALPLVGLGFLLTFAKGKTTRDWGKFIIGFSILFIGLQFLKDSVPDINQNPEILAWLQSYTDMGFLSILLFLFLGTVLTVILQSSSATMALTLVMCFEGWIPFDLAVAMVLGENIGTTITANLAALVANYNAKRTARAHFIFNIIGVIWMLLLFYPFLNGVDWFVTSQGGSSPYSSPEAIPIALSVFHTSFNIINTTLLIFFVPLIVKVVVWLIPAVVKEEPGVDMPKFLDKSSLKYPQTAMRALLDESKRLLEGPTFKIVSHALNLHRTDIKSEEKIKKIVKDSKETIDIDIDEIYYNKVKTIYSKIIKYATITQSEFKLKPKKVEAINNLKLANRYMVEVIKDCKGLQANVAEYMNSDNKYIQKEYDKLRRKVSKVLRKVYLIGTTKDPQKHQKALEDLKIEARESDVMVDGTLDELIREGHINSEMGTSLANDSDNVASISKHLIEVAELLYIDSDPLLKDLPKKKKDKSKKK
jgi:phosphate:Na+ symporter